MRIFPVVSGIFGGAHMKTLKKNNFFIKVVAAVIVVVFILGIVKDQIVRSTVMVGASAVLGAPVKVDQFSVGVLRHSVRIKGFKIYNPEGFPADILLDMAEVSVDYNLGALLQGKLHLPLAVIDLQEMVIVKNKDGKLNVDALKVAQKQETPAEDEKASKPTQEMPMQIDMLTLNIGKVVFKDYSKGDQPVIEVFDVNLKDKTFKDIKSAQQFALLIMVEAMKPTAIKSAGMYAAATILGVGFLPAGVAGALLGKDHATAEFSVGVSKLYDVAAQALKTAGQVTLQNKAQGILKGKIDGCDINITIEQKTGGKTALTISARKYMLPKQEIAQGLLYQIQEKVK